MPTLQTTNYNTKPNNSSITILEENTKNIQEKINPISAKTLQCEFLYFSLVIIATINDNIHIGNNIYHKFINNPTDNKLNVVLENIVTKSIKSIKAKAKILKEKIPPNLYAKVFLIFLNIVS